MKFASFDMGYKNLAVCCGTVDNNEITIGHWSVESIVEGQTKAKKPTIHQLVHCLSLWLNDKEALFGDVDEALIEIQPAGGFHRRSNTPMKCLSHCLQFWFEERGKTVKFISPKRKLQGADFKHVKDTKQRYNLHKQYAIDLCTEKIKNSLYSDWFQQLKKKDDAADAFLQAYVTYIK